MKTLAARFPLPPVEFTFAGFTWPRHVAVLPAGSLVGRLEKAKTRCTGPYYHASKPVVGAHPGQGFYLDDQGMPGLRWAWCDEVEGVRIGHTGWYFSESRETIRGLVFRLPHGRGFLAGWSMGEGMASQVDGYVWDDENDAARAANDMAESAAGLQREFEESQRAEDDE